MRYRWPEGKQSAAVLSFDFDAESGFLFREPEKAKRSLGDLEERRFGPAGDGPGGRRPVRPGAGGTRVPHRCVCPGVRCDALAATQEQENDHESALHPRMVARVASPAHA